MLSGAARQSLCFYKRPGYPTPLLGRQGFRRPEMGEATCCLATASPHPGPGAGLRAQRTFPLTLPGALYPRGHPASSTQLPVLWGPESW